MKKKRVVWWCHKCERPNYTRKACPSCDAEHENTWRCSGCKTINIKSICACGNTRATQLRNAILINRLSRKDKDTGYTVWEAVQKYAYGYAYKKNIPMYLVEDALGNGVERVLKRLITYDPSKATGGFKGWVMAVVRNEIRNAVRSDMIISKNTAVSLDAGSTKQGEQLVIEAIEGASLGLPYLLEMEERQELGIMRRVAVSVFGTYPVNLGDGNIEHHSLFEACVRAYEDRDGVTWAAEAARRTGVSRRVIYRRRDQCQESWQEWKARASSDSLPGGLGAT